MEWIDLDSVINDYLSRSEQPNHKYKKIFDIAFGGMEQLGLDFFYKIKSVRLPVLGNKTFQIPGDCLKWTKVGYFDGMGGVVPFAYNGNQSSFAGLLSTRLDKNVSLFDAGGFYDPYSSVFYNYNDGSGGTVVNIYGTPGGAPFAGSFSISDGFVLLDAGFSYSYVCFEYVANPGGSGEQYYIPVQFREALIAWIGWQDIMFLPPSRRGGAGDKRERERNFYNQRRLGNAQYNPIRLDQEYIWNLANTRICVKA